MESIDFVTLGTIASTEFPDIVLTAVVTDNKLRVLLVHNSYFDFWWSLNIEGRYAHHWERRHIDGTIYRFDNAPHTKWQHVKSFPHHLHFRSDSDVRESDISLAPPESIRHALTFAQGLLRSRSSQGQ